jgi:hypothetical protein
MLAIAGIGSRQTPTNILAEMAEVGRWCWANEIELRSGRAPGADQAFERGALQYCSAYLPWPLFEAQASGLRGRLIVPDNWVELCTHAGRFHPAWGRLGDGARKLMARNSAQILGLDLKSPVQAVVCWTDGGGTAGGTGQALRIAATHGVPIFNMYFEQFSTAERVIGQLNKVLVEYCEQRLNFLSKVGQHDATSP